MMSLWWGREPDIEVMASQNAFSLPVPEEQGLLSRGIMSPQKEDKIGGKK